MSDKGIWILEFSYLPLMLKNLLGSNMSRTCNILFTYSFQKDCRQNALKILKIKFNEINGSIEVICAKKESNFKIDKKLILKLLRMKK